MNGEIAILLEAARMGVSGALVAVGLVFMVGGAIGVLRFPDFYTRLHAAGVGDLIGGVIVIAGLAVASGDAALAARLALLALLMMALAPSVTHMAANAAHAGGLSPMAGAYVAPRPGAKPRRP